MARTSAGTAAAPLPLAPLRAGTAADSASRMRFTSDVFSGMTRGCSSQLRSSRTGGSSSPAAAAAAAGGAAARSESVSVSASEVYGSSGS